MKNNKVTDTHGASLVRSKRLLIIFTSVFLGCVLLFGIIFGTIALVKNSRSVMRYKGIYLNEGVSNYLCTSFKYDYIRSLNRMGIECYDTDAFWESDGEDGKTQGELLSERTEEYLKQVIVGSYLFDRNTRLSKDDKAVIDKAVTEVLEYRANSDVSYFNELAEDMGFTYRDFKTATEMLYKYEMAQKVIFGYDGASLSSGMFGAECDEYFESTYSRVKLMIIRTEGEYAIDPETGKEVYSEFDEDKKAQIQDTIGYIRTLIYNTENEVADVGMNELAFDSYIKDHFPTGTVNDAEGYYFSPVSSYSVEFALDAPEVVRKALSLDVGHYAEAEIDVGVCFIYRCPLEEGAYERISLAHFFSDFYERASDYLYICSLESYSEYVTVKDKYDKYAIIDKPYNQIFSVKFG